MQYGNRGMNQPCIDMRIARCYPMTQNLGYAVDSNSVPDGCTIFFVNTNHKSKEGNIHKHKPFFSLQVHVGPTNMAPFSSTGSCRM
ncbi:hypothetical protein PI125_g21675 [Phytophthora idaei]|nr:hypothetical protein PI125_g21675 [Phytophthora idaei]KAG3131472.1 hypothetical protein PI126_g20041 [Phytophthora idaei]